MKKEKYKGLLLIVLLALLLFPLCQTLFPLIQVKKLKGAFAIETPEELTFKSWLDGRYQLQAERVLNQQFGFRDWLVRLNNQIQYTFFDELKVKDVLKGKEGYLFSVDFAKNYTGKKTYNDQHLDSVMLRLLKIDEWLRSRKKHLLICIAPCKESYLPQYLPDTLKTWHNEKTLYKYFSSKYEKNNLSVLDYQKYFENLRNKTTKTLFSKGAVHWTTYGALLALDTLLKRIKYELHKPVNTITMGPSEITNIPRYDDNDIYDALNLLIEPRVEKFAYPPVILNMTDNNAYRPKVLLIGDSFFFALNNTWIPLRVFSEESYFFYYYKNAIPISKEKIEITIDKIDLLKEIENTDMIILFGSIGTMDIFPYGFDKDLYSKIQ